MPAQFYEVPNQAAAYKRLILYGSPKSVKTPLALAYGAYLRSKNPNSKTLYVASDRGSEDLPSLPDRSWRDFIKVWTPGSPLEADYDPRAEAVRIAMGDWKKHDPNFDLLIWDTFSTDCARILQYIANMEWFASAKTGDKHVTIGDPTLPKNHPARLNIPVQGDFNAMQGITWGLVDALACQKMHVILICHEEEIKDQKGVKKIGPSFVGKALTSKLPGILTGILYTEKTGVPNMDKGGKLESTLHVYSDPGDDMHMAGIRHEPVNGSPLNPIPKVKVGADLVKYWELFFNTLFPTNETVVAETK